MELNQSLIEAAKNGDLVEITRLLEAGADLRAEDDEALRGAAENGHLNVVQLLVEAGADLHAEDDEALDVAAENGHLAVVQFLLEAGANVNAIDDEALRSAAKNGHLEVVQLLLQRGADIHARDDYALRLAAKNGHLEVVQLLLQHGADVHACNDQALHYAAQYGHLKVVQFLLEAGANLHTQDDEALREAARNGHGEVVQFLLEAGANIHARDDGALRWAAWYGHVSVVQLLLENGANVHAEDDWALRWAALKGHLEVVQLLLDHGANLHAKDDEALRTAVAHLKVVQFLLDHGANLHAKDDEALRRAAIDGHLEVVQLLLDHGANLHADNDAPLHWAAKHNHFKIVQLLLDSGADLHADDDLALFWAAEYGRLEITQLLLEAGANVNVINDRIYRELIKKGQLELLKLLLEYGAKLAEVIKPIFLALTRSNRPLLAEQYGVIFPSLNNEPDRMAFLMNEIYHYYPKILTREEPYPYPPPIDRANPLAYYQDLLSYYTLQELFETYEPAIFRWRTRLNVIENIYRNFDRLVWSRRNRHCNNDHTLNVIQGELHGQINKNDVNNPTYSYGKEGNYHCYQQDELEATWEVERDPEHFNFLVPDWSPPDNGHPMMDPTTNEPLPRYFPKESLEQLVTNLSPIDPLAQTISEGLTLLAERDNLLTQARQQYRAMTKEDQEVVELYLAWLLLFGMWLRFWKGPGYPWPRKQSGPVVCEPGVRDQHVIIQLAVRDEILETVTPELKTWLLNLPMARGRAIEPIGSLQKYLKNIQKGKYCMALGADAIIETSQKLIRAILPQKLNQLIALEWQQLIELERQVIERLSRHLTERSDPNFAQEVRQRLEELKQDFELPSELRLEEIEATRHTY